MKKNVNRNPVELLYRSVPDINLSSLTFQSQTVPAFYNVRKNKFPHQMLAVKTVRINAGKYELPWNSET